MRRILYILAAAAIVAGCFTACKDEGKGKLLDPNAKISIRPAKTAQGVAVKAGYLDPVEIVRLTTDIVVKNPKIGPEPYYNFGIAEEQKDLTTPKILMWGMWVIYEDKLTPHFIEAKDVIFVTRQNQDKTKPISDTLAYIPNAQLRAAETVIKAAFANENYDEVYRLFDEAYKFTPINGADWLALKAQNLN